MIRSSTDTGVARRRARLGWTPGDLLSAGNIKITCAESALQMLKNGSRKNVTVAVVVVLKFVLMPAPSHSSPRSAECCLGGDHLRKF